MPLPIWTNQHIVDNLLRTGLSWTTPAVSFGFPTLAPAWARGQEADGFSAFTATQKAAARQAIGLWDDLIATDFAETTSNPRITFQNTTTDIGYAHAYFPGSWAGAGSVWTNPAYNSGTNDLVSPSPGDWGFTAFMHEIGHALGLAHAGNYNGGNPSYATDALYRQDTVMYTIMSYFDAEETGADHIASDGQWYAPQTPMVHDILAIQALYGVETTTHTGNTVYGFHSTANRSVFDFSQNRHPIVCIWDAGGNDTLDLSGFTTASRIDLRPGAFSDADAMTKNISIAFGAWIENAVGGEAGDNITGNDRANRLSGNGGNDVLIGGLGDDNLSGGAGDDRLSGGTGNDVLNGGAGRDLFFFNDAYFGADRIVGFEDGIDRLRFVHTIADSFTDFAITGNGTSQVTVSLGGQTLLLQSAAAITLSAADFIFA